jgi:ribonuclease HII
MKFQIGVDEVGLGAIAGPLCVTAVCVLEVRVEELRAMTHNRDSKMLSAKKREAIAARLKEAPWVYSATVTIPPEEIDREGIGVVLKKALGRAVEQVIEVLDDSVHARRLEDAKYDVIIDGIIDPTLPGEIVSGNMRIRNVPKADELFPSVQAASIIAKAGRDANAFTEDDALASLYGMREHAGYPTPKHLKALREHGVTPWHRRSYEPVKRALTRGGEP